MKEQDLINAVKAYLKTIPHLFFYKAHGGYYGTAGIPDIIICYHGRFIALECKCKGKKPTTLQQLTIDRINKVGGIAVVVYTLEQVKEIIGGATA